MSASPQIPDFTARGYREATLGMPNGERRFYAAMLFDALDAYRRGDPREAEEAAAWFAGYPAPVSFEHCCHLLGYDPGWIVRILGRLRQVPLEAAKPKTFKCGHPRTFENSLMLSYSSKKNPGLRSVRCKECRNAARRKTPHPAIAEFTQRIEHANSIEHEGARVLLALWRANHRHRAP